MAGTVSSVAFAQTTQTCYGSKAGSLACLTVDLTNANQKAFGLPSVPQTGGGDTGISLFAGQLSSAAPLPSPASGFVYAFDPSTGAFIQSSASYGPILSERAETIGARSFSFGFVDQYFDFTKVDGIKASDIPLVVPLAPNAYLMGNYSLHFRLNQFTMFGTYGLTDFLEVSLAAPIINSQLGGSLTEEAHLGPATASASNTINRSATGLGDLQFQLKANLLQRSRGGIAFGVNVRTPTGNPYNLLGAGAVGVEPFLAASTTIRGWLAPHIDVGYQWNGQSVLAAAGGVVTGATRALPSSVPYAAGAEIAVNRRITIAEDVIGTELIHAERAVSGFTSQLNGVTYPAIDLIHKSLNSTSLSSGLKFNPGGHLLLAVNLLARLNHGGLRAAVVPLVGLSYVFEPPSVAPVSPRLAKDAGIPPQPPQAPVATVKAPEPAPAPNRQALYQPDLDRMVGELASQAHFAPNAPPSFIPFHNGVYLQVSVNTTLPKNADGSQYRLAALAFDQHIAHLIRPVLEYLKAHADFDGIDFRTTVTLAGDPPPASNPFVVEFIVPLSWVRSYAQFDSTGQQLIDASYILINGERVSLNLQNAEAGFQSQ